MKAGKSEVIDAVLNVMNKHISSTSACEWGWGILWNISEANYSIQKEICEKKGLTTLIKILKKYNNIKNKDGDVVESCCGAIGVILSSQEIYSKFCTKSVLGEVKKCYEKYKKSEKIVQFFLGLSRKEDSKVRDAVSRGVCTKDAFPKCEDECGCDEGCYCTSCCVQQKAFKCNTCDKGKIVLYCEVCWKKHHKGHDCEEFFCPMRCATK